MFQDFYRKKINKIFNAYTLVEMILAMFFFAAIAVCLSLPFSHSISLSVNDQDMVTANSLAKKYLKSVELQWQFQTDYDTGILPALTNDDTYNDRYKVTVTEEDLAQNSSDIVILRRVTVKYQDKKNNVLINMFTDFNRPESTIK